MTTMATKPLSSPKTSLPALGGLGIDSKPISWNERIRLRMAYTLYFAGVSRLSVELVFKNIGREREATKRLARETLSRLSGKFLARLSRMDCVHCEFIGFEQAAEWTHSLVCANHPSILDALFLFQKLPQASCVVGTNPWSDRLLSVPARQALYVPGQPALRMVKKIRQTIEEGGNMILFPEGTRTPSGALGPFHDGFALAAIKARATVRTVFIECTSMFLGKGFSFAAGARLPIHFRFSTGAVFSPKPDADAREFSQELEEYFRRRLRREGGIHRVGPLE
jgi:hypothetical protein